MRNRADKQALARETAARDEQEHQVIENARADREQALSLAWEIEAEIPAALQRLQAKDFEGSVVVTTTGFMGREVKKAGWAVFTKMVKFYDTQRPFTFYLLSDGQIEPPSPRRMAEQARVPTAKDLRDYSRRIRYEQTGSAPLADLREILAGLKQL